MKDMQRRINMMINNPINYLLKNKFNQGFTLIELMVAVVIMSILAAIAIPSYHHFVRRGVAAQAQQEMEKLAEQLQRHKARNFSFKGYDANYLYTGGTGFTPSSQTLILNSTYTLTIVDSMIGNPLLTSSTATGQGWAIQALSSDGQNYSFLLTSTGISCKNKTAANISYTACGVGQEKW